MNIVEFNIYIYMYIYIINVLLNIIFVHIRFVIDIWYSTERCIQYNLDSQNREPFVLEMLFKYQVLFSQIFELIGEN